MPIVADSAIGVIVVLVPILGVILSVVIIVVEAIVLRLLKWGSFGRSLRDSAVVNFASLLIGVVIGVIVVLSQPFQSFTYTPLGRWLPLIFGVPMWALSVLIEGWLLGRRQDYEPRRIWTAAIVINIVSYLLISVILALIFPLPRIGRSGP